jgi:hypothetical protein
MARPDYSRCADHEVVPRWCVSLSKERAARAAREFPVLLDALEDGRLHLSAVVMLARYLTAANVAELVAAATRRTKAQIEVLLAQRFPRPDVATSIRVLPAAGATAQLSPGTVGVPGPASVAALPDAGHGTTPACTDPLQLSPGTVVASPPAQPNVPVVPPSPPSRVTPLAPERYELRMTLDQETRDLLREAQDLLSHVIPNREAPEVLKRVLQDWVTAQRRRKFGLTDKPRAGKGAAKGRHIPAAVMRRVIARDGGKCTFVGTNGHLCGSRERLQFDHIRPVAKGGTTTVANLRLRCHAHNQLEADRAFGAGFMREKREAAGTAGHP